ncbi:GTP pyrophosphokinase [Desulfoluna spongiiphila]|uniref:GTP pyrophosphokinase n=1 Tax=Desulfoluna spongiiphila TaxID=419481 RepID=UPI00125C002A|nr:(p)ppGpp synthetase [Desulfoluna spongiiphila]VVS94163.1 rela/spot [Desulfoluna spongiiphila]
MPSLDFEKEKKAFRAYYDQNFLILDEARKSFATLVKALITNESSLTGSTVYGRVKHKEECIKKFSRKYRSKLEETETPYEIKEYITDLIGLRVVCLYQDDIEKLSDMLNEHFDVIDVTDKIAELESTEDSFGYKGLHVDLRLNEDRRNLPEYKPYSEFNFEIQIRTIIQDSWSALDHKIKYKKSIPQHLKRRINVLSALFELADSEFREIRDATLAEIEKASKEDIPSPTSDAEPEQKAKKNKNVYELNAFNFLRISGHFFSNYEFETHKVDGFVQNVHELCPGITRAKFHKLINKNITKVKAYNDYSIKKNQTEGFNPYSVIRHCLYLGNKTTFRRVLANAARKSFEEWLDANP